MGRLTLNVLLSFAQFEREVAGERIRDKIAASKKKGMWMGGLPSLGYDVQNRSPQRRWAVENDRPPRGPVAEDGEIDANPGRAICNVGSVNSPHCAEYLKFSLLGRVTGDGLR